ncbi:MAG: pyruvate ferredoxin oxidoreductase, partial [Oscillospiraceae bacterium]|nr:pyruvate ferredoxin oxidoreductase [Oscillospiraceae bacterium]
AEIFCRRYAGLLDNYRTEDADYILVTLGSIAGLCREAADRLREQGIKAGVVRIRYMRPFPNEEIAAALRNAKAFGVLEKDISFGNEGTVYTNVNSALQKAGIQIPGYDFIGGLGGRNISAGDIAQIFADIQNGTNSVNFIGIGGDGNGESDG